MSTDENPQVPARRESREAVREKAALVQAKQRRGRIARTAASSISRLMSALTSFT